MKRWTTAWLLALVLAVAVGGTAAGEASGYLEVKGSDTMVNLGQTWAEEFMERNPRAVIAVTGGGSGTGIAGLINDNLDIAQSSRSMTATEIQMAADNGVEVFEFVVAQDGLAVAVHTDNPRDQFTVAELKAIFTGAVTDWSEMGWAEGGPINVYSRQSNSGTYVFFNENIMDGDDWADGTLFLPGSAAINEAISQNRSGIGYYGIGYVEGVKAVSVARDDNSPAYSPLDKDAVDSGQYPIARPLYFYVNGTPADLTLTYLEWILGEEGQQIIGEIGFYSLTQDYVDANEANFAAIGLR